MPLFGGSRKKKKHSAIPADPSSSSQTVTQTANSLFESLVDNTVAAVTQATLADSPTVYAEPPLPPPTDSIPSTTTYTESHSANLFTQFQNDVAATTNDALAPYVEVVDTADQHANALVDVVNANLSVISDATALVAGHKKKDKHDKDHGKNPGHFSTFKDTVEEKFQSGWHHLTHPFDDAKHNIEKDIGIVLLGAGILFILLWKGTSGARQSARNFVSENVDVLKEGAKTAIQYAPQAIMMAPLLL